MNNARSPSNLIKIIYHRLYVTFPAFVMIENTLDKVTAFHWIVHFRDHEDIGIFRFLRYF